jgi:hypothetical protein
MVELETDISLYEWNRLRDRLDALDRLDAYFPCAAQGAAGSAWWGHELPGRAKAMRDRLEAANTDVYEAIRGQIQSGCGPDGLLGWMRPSLDREDGEPPAHGLGYDYADELISGVFELEEPEDGHIARGSEELSYQPTPARHICSLIGLAAVTAADVFVDLGSGLGHVPMMVSICTGSRSFGIELEGAYVERARECARRLNLDRVTFMEQDAREADLSGGTVFYLYTPFRGSILRAVLELLKHEAATRRIRICTYGPCTPVVAEESWLAASASPDANLITVFHSRA